MLYALDEINNNATILPGIKLGYAIYDSCDSVQLSARHALNFMVNKDFYDFTNVPAPVNSSNKNIVINNNNNNDARPKLIGVVGGAGSSISSLLNNIISSEFMPQISYSSTSETLAQRWRYRSFLRTVPSDKHLAVAIVDMIRFFGWTYVSAFAIDDEYGRVGLQELQAAAKRSGKSSKLCCQHVFGEEFFWTYMCVFLGTGIYQGYLQSNIQFPFTVRSNGHRIEFIKCLWPIDNLVDLKPPEWNHLFRVFFSLHFL